MKICTDWMSGLRSRNAASSARSAMPVRLLMARARLAQEVVQVFQQAVGVCRRGHGRAQHHVVERGQQHPAIEKIEVDGVLELWPGLSFRLRAVTRRLPESELEPRADARHVPLERLGGEDASE